MVSIRNVEIKNFRNIKSASLDLRDRCAVEGQNALGKTNVLEAICFALTNYLLDGSSDLKSIKPKDDPSAKVSVKLTFSNDKTFEKIYFENWVKTRGTDDVKLAGHTTEYLVNGAKVSSVASAQKQLMEDILEINYSPKTSKIDVLQMQVNPLWLFKCIDWSLLRKYIIELVGDVSNEEVIDKLGYSELITAVKNDLVKNCYKTDMVLNLYKSGITSTQKQASIYENSISEDKKISDVDENVYQDAVTQKSALLQLKQLLIDKKNTSVNPKVIEIEKELAVLKEQYNKQKEADLEEYKKVNADISSKIQELQEEFNITSEAYDTSLKFIREFSDKIRGQEDIKKSLEHEIEILNNTLASCRTNYDLVYEKTFDENLILPESVKCPHCGGIVNESYIESVKADFEKRKALFEKKVNADLHLIEDQALKAKLELESKNFKLNEIKTIIFDCHQDYEKHQDFSSKCLENKNNALAKLKSMQSQVRQYEESLNTLYIKSQIDSLKHQLEYEKTRVIINPKIDETIKDYDAKISNFDSVIDKRKFYLGIQEKIKDSKLKLDVELRKLNEFESKTMIVEEFIKTKLSMLDANIAAVFEEIEFVLVSSNIKDGSWNQECYPLIVGTKTPFEHGSRSEQYVTAIKIVEKIKKLVGLPDIPYLIDEAGTFDSNTIANKLVTKSQIITSRMNDNYKAITVNEL